MSRIGTLNLELQEQANDLGYSTVQEATDDGCVVDYQDRRLVTPLELRMNDEQEQAHNDWAQRKEHVINQLKRLGSDTAPLYQRRVIREAIAFIKEGEV